MHITLKTSLSTIHTSQSSKLDVVTRYKGIRLSASSTCRRRRCFHFARLDPIPGSLPRMLCDSMSCVVTRATGSALLFLGLMSTKMTIPTTSKMSSSIIFLFVDLFW